MDISQVFVWLHDTAFATSIRESAVLFPWIESIHVLAITLVVGSIAFVDLRLLGIASSSRSIASLSADVLPLTWTAFAFAVLTGGALFSRQSLRVGRAGKPDGEPDNGNVKLGHETS